MILSVLCFVAAVCGLSAADGKEVRGTTISELERVARDEAVSFNRRLRECSILLNSRYVGHNWVDVEREIVHERLGMREKWEKDHLGFCHYLVRKAAFVTHGYACDLELHFAIGLAHHDTRYAGKVVLADGVARLKCDMPLKELLKREIAPKGSAVAKALQSDRIAEAARRYPFVVSVEASYGMYRDMWKQYNPYGFEVHIELAERAGKGAKRKQEIVFIESHLDAPEAADGAKEPGFVIGDTLGNVLQ